MSTVTEMMAQNISNAQANVQTWGSILFNVKAYGAKGDGTTDDTTAIKACIAACVAAGGGIVYFPKGDYKITSSLNITASIILRGAGRYITSIYLYTANTDIIVLSASFCVIEDLKIANVSGVVAAQGAGIRMNGSSIFATIERCFIYQNYYGIHSEESWSWTIQNNYIVSNYKFGIYISNTVNIDSGDQVIEGNTFDTSLPQAGTSAIRQESGGGTKIFGNKILNHDYGYDMQIKDGVDTSVLTITGGSIESQNIASIRLGRLGTTGTFRSITISGVQLDSDLASYSSVVIGEGIAKVIIGGNEMMGVTGGTAIKVNGGAQICIATNEISDFTNGIYLAAGILRATVAKQGYHRIICPIENNMGYVFEANITHEYINSISLVASASVYTNYYQIEMQQYQGCEIEIVAEGVLGGTGYFNRKVSKLLSRAAGACVVDAITDVASGEVFDIQFDITTTSGSVLIGVKKNSATGTTLDGNIFLNIKGGVNKVIFLNPQIYV